MRNSYQAYTFATLNIPLQVVAHESKQWYDASQPYF